MKIFDVNIYMKNGRLIECSLEREVELSDVVREHSNMLELGKEGKVIEMNSSDPNDMSYVVPIANISHFEIKERYKID